MNNLEILTAARAAISSPSNWMKNCRRAYRDGGMSFCALGAIDDALGSSCDEDADTHAATTILRLCLLPAEEARARARLERVWGDVNPCDPGLVAQFNNTAEHSEVLALFDRAIERQRAFDAMTEAAPVDLVAAV